MSLRTAKNNYDFKGLYEITCYNKSSTFLNFSLFIDCCMSVFFSFLIKALVNVNFVKKNGENLKVLTETICQEVVVSDVISACFDHLKSKVFFVG